MKRLVETVKLWFEVEGTFISAAVTFFVGIALFPLILVLMSVFGWLLAGSNLVQDWEVRFLAMIAEQTSQHFAGIIGSQLEVIQTNASYSGWISIATLLAFSFALFANLERAFARIWQVPKESFGILSNLRRILVHRMKSFLMLLLIIIFVLGNFAVNITMELIANYVPERISYQYAWWLAQFFSSIALNVILFTAVFQIVPRQKIAWRHAIQGGLLTAVLWEPGRYLLAAFIISDNYTAFGLVGAFLAILLWIFYGVNTIFLGATLVRVVSRDPAGQVTE